MRSEIWLCSLLLVVTVVESRRPPITSEVCVEHGGACSAECDVTVNKMVGPCTGAGEKCCVSNQVVCTGWHRGECLSEAACEAKEGFSLCPHVQHCDATGLRCCISGTNHTAIGGYHTEHGYDHSSHGHGYGHGEGHGHGHHEGHGHGHHEGHGHGHHEGHGHGHGDGHAHGHGHGYGHGEGRGHRHGR